MDSWSKLVSRSLVHSHIQWDLDITFEQQELGRLPQVPSFAHSDLRSGLDFRAASAGAFVVCPTRTFPSTIASCSIGGRQKERKGGIHVTRGPTVDHRSFAKKMLFLPTHFLVRTSRHPTPRRMLSYLPEACTPLDRRDVEV